MNPASKAKETTMKHYFIALGDGGIENAVIDESESYITDQLSFIKSEAFTIYEFNGTAQLVDITEAAVTSWWLDSGENDTLDAIECGTFIPGAALRFFADDVARHEARIFAEENAADAHYDARQVA